MTTRAVLDEWLLDLPQQFLDQPKISCLIAAFARQLQQLEQVFRDLDKKTSLETAEGRNLDYMGSIIPLTRKEAGILAGTGNTEDVLPDKRYRQLLKYRQLINTNECTYYDLISGLQLLWDTNAPIYYSENPAVPATINLEVELPREADVSAIRNLPLPRPAGVAIRLNAQAKEDASLSAIRTGIAYAGIYIRTTVTIEEVPRYGVGS